MAAPTIFSAFLVACQITYGWQPLEPNSPQSADLTRSGSDVEYIVQVDPKSLRTLQSVGEITSTIDPRVRSRVGRIVVRIGDGPVPREVPPRSLAGDAKADVRDTAAVAAPTLNRGQASGGKQVVMKPQSGGSMQLPTGGRSDLGAMGNSIRNGVADAASNLAAEAKQRMRVEGGRLADDLGDAASGGIDQLAEKGRSLMSGNLFSGTSADPVRRAGVATGGPSTAEVERDATYRNVGSGFGLPSTAETSASRQRDTAGNPFSTDRSLGNDLLRDRTATAPSLASPRSAADSLAGGNSLRYSGSDRSGGRGTLQPNGLSASESFGQSPQATSANLRGSSTLNGSMAAARENSAIGSPASASTLDPTLTSSNLTEAERLAGGVFRYGDRIYDRNKQIVPRAAIVAAAQQIDRQNYDRADPRYATAGDPRYATAGDSAADADRGTAWWQNGAATGNTAANNGGSLQMNITDPRLPQPDPRLTGRGSDRPASDTSRSLGGYVPERANGLGRGTDSGSVGPIDPRDSMVNNAGMDGRGIDPRWPDRPLANSMNPELRDDRWPSTTSRNAGSTSPIGDSATYADSYAAREARRLEDARRYREEMRLREVADDRAITERRIEDLSRRVENLAPVSPSDQRDRSGVSSDRPINDVALRTATVSHTPQPLFTGLLLVSGIVNFYLFIWLRNIRVRYRDLVSSKRVVEAV